MPSRKRQYLVNESIVHQTNVPEQLRIGLHSRRSTARRYITITKTQVTVSGDSERPKRVLSKRSIDQSDKTSSLVPHLPEVKRGNVRHGIPNLSVPQVLRVSSYPELISKSCPMPFPGKQSQRLKPCRSDTQALDDSDEETENRDFFTREFTQLSLDTLTSSINIKSLARTANEIDKTVKQAIDKFLDGPTPNDPLGSVKQTKIIIRDDDKNGSKRSPRKLNEDSKSKAIKQDRNNKCLGSTSGSRVKQYTKFKKPLLPKIISGTPACMVKLLGPILLSAPHGIKLWRGGTDGRKRRIHYREMYITEIVLKLAAEINKITGYPASFVIWDRRMAMTADFKNLDPNYLTENQFAYSPFHEAIVQFKKYGQDNNFPVMHIDIHGKKNRRNNMDLDIGFRALESRWNNKSFVKWLKTEVDANFTDVFNSSNYEVNDMRFTVNVDPLLCGDWGGDLHTMACQSVCLGIPGFQIEIPKAIRTQLIEDEDLLSKFAKSIVNIYTTCVNGGQNINFKVNPKETLMYAEFLTKVYNDHLKIEKTFPEKQI